MRRLWETAHCARRIGRPAPSCSTSGASSPTTLFVDVFPAILGRVADLRNPGVHRAHVFREDVLRIRNSLLGVGCQGALVELAKVRPKR